MRICIVDDDYSVGRVVQQALERENFRVTYYASSMEYMERFDDHKHDLLICDLEMPQCDGLAIMKEVLRLRPGLPVILISDHPTIPTAVKALKNGAAYILEKPLPIKKLIDTVKAIRHTELMLHFPHVEKLTYHEVRVLRLLMQGYNNREISEILDRSIRTIEDHRNKIMKKVNAPNMVELIKMVLSSQEPSLQLQNINQPENDQKMDPV